MFNELQTFFYPKTYNDLIKNIGYNLLKLNNSLQKKQFRNKCSKQSLRICIKIIENGRFDRTDLLFKIILKYHKYWE